MTKEEIQQTFELWLREPEKARAVPEAKAVEVGSTAAVTAGSFSWRVGMPPQFGGSEAAPSPTTLLLAALAGCAVVFLRETLAPQLGVDVQSAKATARCQVDSRGLLGMLGTIPDLQHLELELAIESASPRPDVDRLVAVWRERCPVYLALVKPIPVRMRVEVIAR